MFAVSSFAAWEIRATLLLRDSEPRRRIAWAVAATNCDLIVISEEPYHWLQRRFLGELIRPLLRRADRPVLVARRISKKFSTKR
jgi:nucleotide-binding universal stress UspA family protein